MPVTDAATPLLTTPDKAELYRTALEMLNRSGVPYMVGGTYAFQYYAGISRTTKDFDIFVRPRDVQRVLDVLTRAGFKTEIAFTPLAGQGAPRRQVHRRDLTAPATASPKSTTSGSRTRWTRKCSACR